MFVKNLDSAQNLLVVVCFDICLLFKNKTKFWAIRCIGQMGLEILYAIE